ncbi:MAG: papain-like cysteine protease family protein [Syntrophomonadaceae bacterium]|nr:papain-like cysteine protease family protein [Syntrophomonadaceae bacterium]MDD3272208.1 papain-like cysteine protease family protein [Syntrophomonadaceae bacterium]MDD4562397.1 papain-like cysteine protease family protein [Syntrophomonadaceae bacterium]
MIKRIVSTACIIMILILVCSTPAFAARKLLSVTAVTQAQSMWCWAACDKSIIQFCKGSSPSQSDEATFLFGSPINQGATTDQIRSVLTNWQVSSSRQFNPLSYTSVVSQINNDHPILTVLDPLSGAFHNNVIRGYDTSNDTVLFFDPSNGSYHAQQYTKYCSGTHWDNQYYNWIHSIFSCQ